MPAFSAPPGKAGRIPRWLNATVLGIGLASFFADWSHEIATTILPAFLAGLGAGAAAWLGLIEGLADGLSSFAKLASGYYTDQLRRRKPVAVAGYLITALGTAALGLTEKAWQVLLCRVGAWLGRGIRTPVRKALLASAVTPATYGRAFGFERMMDTCGAIIGPATATLLILQFQQDFSTVFFLTLIPGLAATLVIAFLVQEGERAQPPSLSFTRRLRNLPPSFSRFLLAVGCFGAGDFSHTLLILLATQVLAPELGQAQAAGLAAGLYVLHNILYAGCAFLAGWLGDRMSKAGLLTAAYSLAACMGLLLVVGPKSLPFLVLTFVLGGMYVAAEEALEDALAAQLVEPDQHGMAFGLLATVNAVGDFVSSVVVGLLWTTISPEAAFCYATTLFVLGALLVPRP